MTERREKISQYLQPYMEECFQKSCSSIQTGLECHAHKIWTEIANSLGVHNEKDFKESKISQKIVMLFYVRWNYQYALTYKFDVHIGTTIEGKIGDNYYKADVSLSRLIAAERLVGQTDFLQDFLEIRAIFSLTYSSYYIIIYPVTSYFLSFPAYAGAVSDNSWQQVLL